MPQTDGYRSILRRNWLAIVAATALMMVSYFTYAAAFVDTETFVFPLLAIGFAIVPFVFAVLAFGSRNPSAPGRVLRAMGVFVATALAVGLIDPALGFACGFAAGGAITLNRPPVDRVMTFRFSAVILVGGYLLVLLIAVSPAGVFAAGVLPLMMVGFADEYAVWTEARSQ